MIKGCIFDMDGTLLDSMNSGLTAEKILFLKTILLPKKGFQKNFFA